MKKTWLNLITPADLPLEDRVRKLLASWKARAAAHRGFAHSDLHQAQANGIQTCYEELAIEFGTWSARQEAKK